jgi:two-component system NtrC family sensor kinase
MLDLCRAVTEISPMPIAGVEGTAHRVAYVNPAFCLLVKKTKEDLIGQDFASIEPIGQQCALLLDQVYRTGSAETHTVREHSGSYPLCSYAMWPVLSGESHAKGIIVQVIEETSIHQDAIAMNEALMLGLIRQHELTEQAQLLNEKLEDEIAARTKAEAALIQSEKLASVGRMSAVIAHEINNPLAAVTDLLYLIKSIEGMPEEAAEYLETADAELKRIAHITRQTLGFYREMAAPTTFPIAGLLSSVLDLLRAKVKAKQAVVECQCDSALEITTMHGELRQVLSNLLTNSLDALGQNGRIIFRASLSHDPRNGGGRIRITVADDGQGIDSANLPQIFEPFFSTKGTIGNGLGLWLSKQIVEKKGGSIRVRSCANREQRGTTFSIVLPQTPSNASGGTQS